MEVTTYWPNGNKYRENHVDGLIKVYGPNGEMWSEYTIVNGNIDGWMIMLDLDMDMEDIRYRFYRNNIIVPIETLVKERCLLLKEELMAYLNHPDRIERIANICGM